MKNTKTFEEFNFKPTADDLKVPEKIYNFNSFSKKGVEFLKGVGFKINYDGNFAELHVGEYVINLNYYYIPGDDGDCDNYGIVWSIKNPKGRFFKKTLLSGDIKINDSYNDSEKLSVLRKIMTKIYQSEIITPTLDDEESMDTSTFDSYNYIKTFEELNEEQGSGDLPACSCGRKKKSKKIKKGQKSGMRSMKWSGFTNEKCGFCGGMKKKKKEKKELIEKALKDVEKHKARINKGREDKGSLLGDALRDVKIEINRRKKK